jgi:hypothetical protein
VDLAEQSPERPATADQELVAILDRGLERLAADSTARAQLETIKNELPQAPTDPDDPWRGKFGGTSSANGTVLEARIEESPNDPNFFMVNLNVRIDDEARKDDLLGTKVIYFLHPTFPNQPRISAFGEDGRAPLELYAYGAFTVGAFLEDGTKLELNLATIEGAPVRFRSK